VERLTIDDARFLDLEDEVSAMHNVTALVFERPEPPYGRLLDRVAERIPAVPRLRQRVVDIPLGLARPAWIDDPQFSLDYHVRHTGLPHRATDSDFRNLIGRLQSQRLDRGKPLWELWMVSGLPGRRWALVSKAHHAMVDGVSGADPLSLVIDQAKAGRGPSGWNPGPAPSEADLVSRAVAELALNPREQLRLTRRVMTAPLSELARLSHRPTAESRAGMGGAVSPHRRWQEVEVGAEDIRAVRDELDVATNDVVLGLVTAGLRAMLVASGNEPPATIRTLAPLAIATGDRFTNEVSALEADLPVGLSDVRDMIRCVFGQTAPAAGHRKAVAGATLADLRGLVAPTLCALGLRSATLTGASVRDVETVTINAPGPRERVTVLDRPMSILLPAIPLVARVRVAVGVMSYRGRFGFGVTGDRDTGVEVATVADGIAAAIDDAVSGA
jgi:WS/DGAT/MGAT family acyltransferase